MARAERQDREQVMLELRLGVVARGTGRYLWQIRTIGRREKSPAMTWSPLSEAPARPQYTQRLPLKRLLAILLFREERTGVRRYASFLRCRSRRYRALLRERRMLAACP